MTLTTKDIVKCGDCIDYNAFYDAREVYINKVFKRILPQVKGHKGAAMYYASKYNIYLTEQCLISKQKPFKPWLTYLKEQMLKSINSEISHNEFYFGSFHRIIITFYPLLEACEIIDKYGLIATDLPKENT